MEIKANGCRWLDNSVYIQTNVPVNPKKKWLGYAISDSALLHVTLLHSALHMSFLKGISPAADVFFHSGMAIRLINERLNDRSQKATDFTICAIACLANFEVC
jgi:hypothetical protein